MRLLALAVVCALIAIQDGLSVGAALQGVDPAQRTHATGGY